MRLFELLEFFNGASDRYGIARNDYKVFGTWFGNAQFLSFSRPSKHIQVVPGVIFSNVRVIINVLATRI